MTSRARPSAASLWLGAAAIGFLLCLPDFLIIRHRLFYESRLPEAAARWALNGRYTVLPALDDPDAHEWAARVRDAADHVWPQDPHIKENSSRRLATLDTLSFFLLGRLYRLTGGINSTWLTARWLFGMAGFGALFFVLSRLSRAPFFSAALAAISILYFDLFDDIVGLLTRNQTLWRGLKDMFARTFWLLGNYHHFFGMARLVRPAMTFPFLLAAILLGSSAGESWAAALASGALGGALIYVHMDIWFVYATGFSLLVVLGTRLKNRPNPKLVLSWLVMMAACAPWLALNLNMDADMLARSEAVLGRGVNPYGLIYAIAAAAFWRVFSEDSLGTLLCCILCACGLALETQCVTGYNLEPLRWHAFGILSLLILGAGALGRRLKDGPSFLWPAAVAAALTVGRVTSYAAQRFPFQALPRDVETALEYLKQSTPPDSVVASLGPQETMLIPVYTHNKTLLTTACVLVSDISTRENLERLRRGLEIDGIPETRFLDRLRVEIPTFEEQPRWNKELWSGVVDWDDLEWSSFFHYHTLKLPPEAVFERMEALRAEPIERRFQIDYVWIGPFERGLMPPAAAKRLGTLVYENPSIQIYRR